MRLVDALSHQKPCRQKSADFDRVTALFRRLLKPNGLFLLGDVVPPGVPAVSDAFALLRFAKANGFLLAALGGLVRTVFSDYWRLRPDRPDPLQRGGDDGAARGARFFGHPGGHAI